MYNAENMATDEIIRRALAAYARTVGEPMPTTTLIETYARLRYVVLRRRGRLLACYRVRNDGQLKRLIRLPDNLRG